MILIEEVSNISRLNSYLFLLVESRNTLHVSIRGNESIVLLLDRLTLSSDINLYCLASNGQECPSHFQVIQVDLIGSVDSRV